MNLRQRAISAHRRDLGRHGDDVQEMRDHLDEFLGGVSHAVTIDSVVNEPLEVMFHVDGLRLLVKRSRHAPLSIHYMGPVDSESDKVIMTRVTTLADLGRILDYE